MDSGTTSLSGRKAWNVMTMGSLGGRRGRRGRTQWPAWFNGTGCMFVFMWRRHLLSNNKSNHIIKLTLPAWNNLKSLSGCRHNNVWVCVMNQSDTKELQIDKGTTNYSGPMNHERNIVYELWGSLQAIFYKCVCFFHLKKGKQEKHINSYKETKPK